MAPKSKIHKIMPAALVIAERNGDVGTRDRLRYLKRQLKPLTTTCTLPGGTHGSFSTKPEPIHDPECKEKDQGHSRRDRRQDHRGARETPKNIGPVGLSSHRDPYRPSWDASAQVSLTVRHEEEVPCPRSQPRPTVPVWWP